MRILALIPARGGSKRLPGKNTKLLGGKPLINWTIESALGIPEICDVLVSTDDSEIEAIAKLAGAHVPWLRPSELATDEATSVDVAIHALDWYEHEHGDIDGLLLLQPTSPFRTRATIERGIKLFEDSNEHSILGVSPCEFYPLWSFVQVGEYLKQFVPDQKLFLQSKPVSPIFVVNGSLYLVSPGNLRSNHSFYSARTIPLHVDSPIEALDIDTHWDFKIASSLWENQQFTS
jgi:CMP-N,N'-diacetyllegionaminic acid synthase